MREWIWTMGELETLCGKSRLLRSGGPSGSGDRRSSRSTTGDGFDVTAEIRFTTICPRCCGRARVMFGGRGKTGCRRCLRVRYRSQCGDAKDRAHLAIARIEKRLITRRVRFCKPKGMLWRTFHRLCDRYDHHDAVLNAGLMRAVAILARRGSKRERSRSTISPIALWRQPKSIETDPCRH